MEPVGRHLVRRGVRALPVHLRRILAMIPIPLAARADRNVVCWRVTYRRVEGTPGRPRPAPRESPTQLTPQRCGRRGIDQNVKYRPMNEFAGPATLKCMTPLTCARWGRRRVPR